MKIFIIGLVVLLLASISYAGSMSEAAKEDVTQSDATAVSMASLELDPTRDGFSVSVAIGVADFADGDDEFGEAVGLMYGKDDKAINFKYARSGSYAAAGVGLTMGF
jgi:uncharacterized protein YpmB